MKAVEIVERLNSKRATRKVIADEIEISSTTLTRRLKEIGYVYDQRTKTYSLPEPIEGIETIEITKNLEIQTSTPRETNIKKDEVKNDDFTPDEIKVLKEIIAERKSDIQLFHEYRIYKELSKVPTDAETVRSAFNMSKETTERLKKYANERRLPLQDLVELAVINLLDNYNK